MAGSAIGRLNMVLGIDSTEFTTGLTRAEQIAVNFSRNTQRGLGGIESQARRTADSLTGMQSTISNLAKTAAAGFSAQQVIRYADAWTATQGRLSLVVDTQEKLVQTTQELQEVATRTRQPLEGIVDFYSRLAQFIPEAERAQFDLLGVTESVSTALAITGETGASSSAALVQFTQAIGTNFEAAGQELRSLQEQAPRLTQALMRALGDGTKSLQQLKDEGKLTRESVLNALSSTSQQGRVMAEELARIPKTFSQALTLAQNSALQFFGELNQSTGAVTVLADGIAVVADNLQVVIAAIGTYAGLRLGQTVALSTVEIARNNAALVSNAVSARASAAAQVEYARMQLASAQATVANATGMQRLTLVTTTLIPAQNALTAATAAYAATSSTAAIAARGLLAVLGGPIGAITLAVTAGVIAWQTWGQTANKQIEEVLSKKNDLDALTDSFRNLTTLQQAQAKNELGKQLREAIDEYETQLRRLGSVYGDSRGSLNGFNSSGGSRTGDFVKQIQQIQQTAKTTQDLDSQLSALINRTVQASGGSETLRASLTKQAAAAIESRRAVDAGTAALQAMSGAQQAVANSASAANEELGAQTKSLADFYTQYATQNERLQQERQKYREQLGPLYTAEVDRRIVERFTDKRVRQVKEEDTAAKNLANTYKDLYATARELTQPLFANDTDRFEYQVDQLQNLDEALNTVIRDSITLQRLQESVRDEESQRIDAIGAQVKENDRLRERASSIADSLDPMREYNRLLAEYQILLEKGLLTPAQYSEASAEAAKAVAENFQGATEEMSEFARQAARSIQSTLGDTLYDVLDGNFNDIGDSFSKMLKRMAADLLASEVSKFLLGNYGSSGQMGGIFGAIVSGVTGYFTGGASGGSSNVSSGIVLGGRATGGNVAPSSIYQVNERGPELYTANGKTYLMSGDSGGFVTPSSPNMPQSNAVQNSGAVNVSVVINSDGTMDSSATSGSEQFARDIGEFVDSRFRLLQAQSFRQGGMNWQSRNGMIPG